MIFKLYNVYNKHGMIKIVNQTEKNHKYYRKCSKNFANDCKYRSKLLQEKEINVLPWSSNSPDLNPIVNLRKNLKKLLQEVVPRGKKDLSFSFKVKWANRSLSQ